MHILSRYFRALSLILAAGATYFPASSVAQDETPNTERKLSQEELELFENEVRPILADHCTKCHGRQKQEGALRLDTQEGMLLGGDSGSAIDSGSPNDSLLLSAVRYEDYEMPPSGKLSENKIAILEKWVARGAPWPSHAGDGGLELRAAKGISEEDRNYWAFQSLKSTKPPSNFSEHISKQLLTPIDAFIADKLAQSELTFAPPADKRVLVRRLYFDLVGVPPTPEETNRFLENTSPAAYEQLVEELLGDPRYGEKWSRHWLDLVRYAESDGYNQDAARPTAYLYRDWVIQALNDDMPYDDFVAAQLAGDEIDPADANMMAATGYLRNWIYEYNQRDVRSQWENVLNDITDVTGEVFFGLGMGCARCHDHKFDPILQKDYFRLRASFAAFVPQEKSVFGSPEQLASYHEQLEQWQSRTESIRQQMDEIENPIKESIANTALTKFPLDVRPILFKPADERDGYEQQLADFAHRQVVVEWDKLDWPKKLKGDQKARWEELQAELKKFDDLKPKALPRILSAGSVNAPPPPMFIPPSGSSEAVPPESFEVFGGHELSGIHEAKFDDETPPASSGRRLRLAQWINSPENPLPHRVLVNRFWQYHFGNGIVSNASDFGRLGQPPTHPELLDFLAVWFLDNGRSMKELHKLIVTSGVYRQSSQRSESEAQLAQRVDLDNQLLWRFPARRLDAEQIRDAMLVASGSLSAKRSGPSESHDSYCRSAYTTIKRNSPNPFLTTFDAPDGSASVGKRQVTTTPNQSLLLSNASWPLKLASEMAEEIIAGQSSPVSHVTAAYLRCLQREPSPEEIGQAIEFLRLATAENVATAHIPDPDSQGETQATDTEEDPTIAEAGEAAASVEPARPTKWYQSKHYQAALGDFCHILFNSSEFLYLQ